VPVPCAGEQIYQAVTRWEEIAHALHRFGGTEFRVGRREVAHVHGDSLVDIPFPLRVRNELVKSGAADRADQLSDGTTTTHFLLTTAIR
jgi:luciferase-like monooxygenase